MNPKNKTNPVRAGMAAALAAAWLVSLGGCAGGPAATPAAPAARTVQAPGKPVLVLRAADEGAEVVLERGQVLRVELPLDADAVNANMDWLLADLSPREVLKPLGTAFERQQRNDNPSEISGTAVWRFQPVAAGKVSLAFELRRARIVGPAVQTLHLDVTVR